MTRSVSSLEGDDDWVSEAIERSRSADGVAPDGWSFIPVDELNTGWREVVEARLGLWRPEMGWCRLTDTSGQFSDGFTPEGVWIEVWKARPEKEAAFAPPLVDEVGTAAILRARPTSGGGDE